MYALSTSWNAFGHTRARALLAEIKALGFEWVELSFNLSKGLVREIIKLKEQGSIKVISVHNFCPIPKGVQRKQASPDIFSLSSLDETTRQKAVRFTKCSIDTAALLGAKAVILHLGRVQIKDKIRDLASAYQKDKRQFKKLKESMVRERALLAPAAFLQALKSLEQLSPYAQKSKIKLGIENRYYFNEIPSIQEMGLILKTFRRGPIYYWHDVGHAQVYDYLKLASHQEMLKSFQHRMLGIHLHDIQGIDDHRAPLRGNFDFTQLKPYIRKTTIKVLEPHYPATAAEIVKGKKYLEELFKTKKEKGKSDQEASSSRTVLSSQPSGVKKAAQRTY